MSGWERSWPRLNLISDLLWWKSFKTGVPAAGRTEDQKKCHPPVYSPNLQVSLFHSVSQYACFKYPSMLVSSQKSIQNLLWWRVQTSKTAARLFLKIRPICKSIPISGLLSLSGCPHPGLRLDAHVRGLLWRVWSFTGRSIWRTNAMQFLSPYPRIIICSDVHHFSRQRLQCKDLRAPTVHINILYILLC